MTATPVTTVALQRSAGDWPQEDDGVAWIHDEATTECSAYKNHDLHQSPRCRVHRYPGNHEPCTKSMPRLKNQRASHENTAAPAFPQFRRIQWIKNERSGRAERQGALASGTRHPWKLRKDLRRAFKGRNKRCTLFAAVM